MNVPSDFAGFFAKVARESGYEQLWTALTTALDEQLAAVCEAGNRERQGLPPFDGESTFLTQIETKVATCHEQLRAAAEKDLMALFLLNHSMAANCGVMTFSQRFGIAGRLRQMAERWTTSDPKWSEMSHLTADGLVSDLQFNLHLDTDSENALAQEVYELGGVMIPTTWQGWPFPRLTVPFPPRRSESPAEIEARWAWEDRATKGWEQAVVHRLCTSNAQLNFWFPQVISEEELDLPANRVNDAFPFPELFTSEDWPVIQLQVESPPNVVKRPSILSLNATYGAFRCNWDEEDFTPEDIADFQSRLETLRNLFVQLHEWCQRSLIQLDTSTFCGPTLWKNNEKFRHSCENS